MCLKQFEGADVKYHSTVAVSSSSPKLPKENNFGPTFNFFFFRKTTFWQIEGAEVKHDNSFFLSFSLNNTHMEELDSVEKSIQIQG